MQCSPAAFFRHHACEMILFALLATPVFVIRPSIQVFCLIVVFYLSVIVLGYLSDRPTVMSVHEEGVEYLAGGSDRHFVAWSETAKIVPRFFRGWPAEDALVILDHRNRPLLLAPISMFERSAVEDAIAEMRDHVDVTPPVYLSPFTARAGGRKRPELVPARSSERFLASAVLGLIGALIAAAIIVIAVP